MTKKQKRIIAIVSAVIILIVIIVITAVMLNESEETTDTTTNTITETNSKGDVVTDRTTNSGDTTATNGITTNTTEAVVVNQNEAARIIARANSFTERYGSYSSDNDFENVEELREFMTGAMDKTANALIAKGNKGSEFYGITTKAAITDIIEFEEGASGATVTVGARRTETKGTQDASIFSQTARLQLKKVDGVWKVDTFKWQ